MRARPILFSGPMVRALLEGRKSQTRRVVKPQPNNVAGPYHPESRGITWVWMARDDFPGYTYATQDFRCPYGKPGGLLWVRETFGCLCHNSMQPMTGCELLYRATDDHEDPLSGWRPSIHMPRWASRLTLRLTDVRVERVQDISEEDALAEGCRSQVKHSALFADLWESINAKRGYSWESNPWVWALLFEVIQKNVDEVKG